MIEQREGWFTVNVQDARWVESADFGRRVLFEREQRFPEIGINIAILEPGKPNCRYHRESAQENFLVLSGECLLLVNGEEKRLGAWDFVHCPAGTSHVFIGAGDGPCVVLMIGSRPKDLELFYPHDPLAARHGAQSPEPTPDPHIAYAGVERPGPISAPRWPLEA